MATIPVDKAGRRRVKKQCAKAGVPADDAEINFIIKVVCGEG